MRAFLDEHALGTVQPATLAAVAESFAFALTPKRRGRPKKGKRGLAADLCTRLNSSQRTHWELHVFIARGLSSGLSWGRVMASAGVEFGMTRDGIRRALNIFRFGSAAKFRESVPRVMRTLQSIERARPTLELLRRVDWSDLPDDIPLTDLLQVVRARADAENK